MSAPANPLAFPRTAGSGWGAEDGMTLRDWFAGQALGGLMAAGEGDGAGATTYAFFLADKMLAEREQGK